MKNVIKATFAFLFAFATVFSAHTHAGTKTFFIHTDHLGTPQVMTDKDQNVVWRRQQTPFGETVSQTDTTDQPQRFPGQYEDKETGYYYNYFRDYDPTIGRYIQSDPIGLAGGINTYGYVFQSPLTYFDFDGLRPNNGRHKSGCRSNAVDKGDPCGCFEKAFLGIDDAVVAGTGLAAGAVTGPFATKPRTGISAGGPSKMRTSYWSKGVSYYNSKHGKSGASRLARNAGRKIFTRAIPGAGTALLIYDSLVYDKCMRECDEDECKYD